MLVGFAFGWRACEYAIYCRSRWDPQVQVSEGDAALACGHAPVWRQERQRCGHQVAAWSVPTDAESRDASARKLQVVECCHRVFLADAGRFRSRTVVVGAVWTWLGWAQRWPVVELGRAP